MIDEFDTLDAGFEILEAYLDGKISKEEAEEGIQLMRTRADKKGLSDCSSRLQMLVSNIEDQTKEWLREQYKMEYPGD